MQVIVRCRPFSCDDQVGVFVDSANEKQGKTEVMLVNGNHSTRYPFNHSWWSAFGYERHVQPDEDGVYKRLDKLPLITQTDAYNNVGKEIRDYVLDGHVVVIFAYGLSGSGKTYTVFGPDMPEDPCAWYNFSSPHEHWGFFPRIMYDVLEKRTSSWKITIKYYQNVVDTVRDLLSPQAIQKHYKDGLHKDKHGFLDMNWCQSVAISDWSDLIDILAKANARKAISATQFNHSSTRGHCILVLNVDRPHPDDPRIRQLGRLYVSDLAGTEPAGDIVSARYKRRVVQEANGSETIEYDFLGPESDRSKTKDLQNQGKKINLSLSEMAQFFRKMADGIKRKTLKPGGTIPGCNNFFLGKLLKETMLHARTYLCAAVRPEVQFETYNVSTLEFAKAASTVTLGPRRLAQDTPTPPVQGALLDEMKLMQSQLEELGAKNQALASEEAREKGELASLRQSVVLLEKEEQSDRDEVEMLRQALAEKKAQLEEEISNEHKREEEIKQSMGGGPNLQAVYEQAGITTLDPDFPGMGISDPFLVNVDEDEFHSYRYMYILSRPVTNFGIGKDIAPIVHEPKNQFCSISVDEAASGRSITLTSNEGEIFVNGTHMEAYEAVPLTPGDRVVFGGSIMILYDPAGGHAIIDATGGLLKLADAHDATAEYEAGVLEWGAQKASDESLTARLRSGSIDLTSALANDIKRIEPIVQKTNHILQIFNRNHLHCTVGVQTRFRQALHQDETSGNNATNPEVRLTIEDSTSGHACNLSLTDFVETANILESEFQQMRVAISNKWDYSVGSNHDPTPLFFNHVDEVGYAEMPLVAFVKHNDHTHTERLEIKSFEQPHKTVGYLEIDLPPFTDDLVIGQPWESKIEIRKIVEFAMDVQNICCTFTLVDIHCTTPLVETHPGRRSQAICIDHDEHVKIPTLTHDAIVHLNHHSMTITVLATRRFAPPPEGDALTTSHKPVVENIRRDSIIAQFGGALQMASQYEMLAAQAKQSAEQIKVLENDRVQLETDYRAEIKKLKEEHEFDLSSLKDEFNIEIDRLKQHEASRVQKITDELVDEQEHRAATDAEESQALTRIEELEMEVKRHELSIKRSEELLRRAEQEKKKASAAFEEQTVTSDASHKREIDALKATMRKLQKQNETEMHKLKVTLESKEAAGVSQAENLATLNTTCEQLEQDLQLARLDIKSKDEGLESLKDDLQRVEDALEETRSETREMSSKYTEDEGKLKRKAAEDLRRIQMELDREHEVRVLREETSKKMREKKDTLEKDLKRSKQNMLSKSKEIEASKATVHDLEQRLNEAEEALESQVADHARVMEALKIEHAGEVKKMTEVHSVDLWKMGAAQGKGDKQHIQLEQLKRESARKLNRLKTEHDSNLEAVKGKMNSDRQRLEKENSGLQLKMSQLQRTNSMLEEELTGARHDIEMREVAEEDMAADVLKIRSQIKLEREQRTRNETTIGHLEESCGKLQGELDRAQVKIESKEAEASGLAHKVTLLQTRLEETRSLLESQVREQKEEMEAIKQSYANDMSALTAARATCDERQQKLQKMEKEIASAKHEAEKEKTNALLVAQDLKAAMFKAQAAEKELSRMKSELSKSENALARLHVQKTDEDEQLQKMREDARVLEEKLGNAQKELKSMTSSIEQIREESGEALENLSFELNTTKREKAQLESKVEAEALRINKLINENKSIEMWRGKFESCENEFGAFKRNSEDTIARHKRQYEHLEKSSRVDAEHAGARLKMTEEKFEALKIVNLAQESRINELETDRRVSSDTLARQKTQLEHLEKHAKVEAEHAESRMKIVEAQHATSMEANTRALEQSHIKITELGLSLDKNSAEYDAYKRSTNDSLARQKSEIEHLMKSAKVDSEHAASRLKMVEDQHASIIASTTRDLENATRKAEQLEETLDTKIQEEKGRMHVDQTKITELENKLRRSEEDLERTKDELRRTEEKNTDALNSSFSAERDFEEKERLLNGRLETAKNKITGLEESLYNAKREFRDEQSARRNAEENVRSAARIASEKQQDSESRLEAANNINQKTQMEIKELKDLVLQAERRARDFEAEKRNSEHAQKVAAELASDRIGELEARLASNRGTLEKNAVTYRDNLSNISQNNTALEDALQRCKREMENEKTSHLAELATLQRELESKQHMMVSLQTDMKVLQDNNEMELQTLRESVKSLTTEKTEIIANHNEQITKADEAAFQYQGEQNQRLITLQQKETTLQIDKARLEREVLGLKSSLESLQKLHEDVEKSHTVQRERVLEAHTHELMMTQKSFDADHEHMVQSLDRLRSELINTRHTLAEEADKRLDEERESAQARVEKIRHSVEATLSEAKAEFTSRERGWNMERKKLLSDLSEARQLAGSEQDRLLSIERKYKGHVAELAECRRDLRDAKEALRQMEIVNNIDGHLVRQNISPHQLKHQELEDATVKIHRLEDELQRRVDENRMLAKRLENDQYTAASEVSEVTSVLTAAQSKWADERRKLKREVEELKQFLVETKGLLNEERRQNAEHSKFDQLDRGNMNTMATEYKRQAREYEAKWKQAMSRSTNDQQGWHSQEISLRSQIEDLSSHVKRMERQTFELRRQRDSAVDSAHELRESEIASSSAYNSLLRKGVASSTPTATLRLSDTYSANTPVTSDRWAVANSSLQQLRDATARDNDRLRAAIRSLDGN